jgi:hypothetical protein
MYQCGVSDDNIHHQISSFSQFPDAMWQLWVRTKTPVSAPLVGYVQAPLMPTMLQCTHGQ